MSLFGSRWIVQMAWRDSRSFRQRLLLFTGSIAVGIAALVAIGSLAVSMERGIDAQANALLGADMAIHGRRPFTEAVLSLFDSLGGEQARQVIFSSMALFPKNQNTGRYRSGVGGRTRARRGRGRLGDGLTFCVLTLVSSTAGIAAVGVAQPLPSRQRCVAA